MYKEFFILKEKREPISNFWEEYYDALDVVRNLAVSNRVWKNMKNHRGHRVTLILCVLYTMTYMILQGSYENSREK